MSQGPNFQSISPILPPRFTSTPRSTSTPAEYTASLDFWRAMAAEEPALTDFGHGRSVHSPSKNEDGDALERLRRL